MKTQSDKTKLVQHMVNRFLGWHLPEDFHPDNGISYENTYTGWGGERHPRQPVGTNLFTATQAEAMVRHMLEGYKPEQLLEVQDMVSQSDKTELEKQVRWILDTRHTVPAGQSHTDTYTPRLVEFITARENRMVQEAVDKWVAHVLENIYPLDVFNKETGGGHIAGIYHGMHILRREVRELSAREDLEKLPQETEEYYTHRSQDGL